MEVSGQLHTPATLLSGKKSPGIHWIVAEWAPRVGVDAMAKRKYLFPARK
jgi:hypothetical protein